jgi:hypothetical protein
MAICYLEQFKRDYKREAKGSHRHTLMSDFAGITQPWRTISHLQSSCAK